MASYTSPEHPSSSHTFINPFSIFFIILSLASTSLATDGINGCGGFIEASAALAKLRKPSDPKLDYSHIVVELHTVEGLVKDRIQCAPNGYYFVPVYDKGTFVLTVKGPEGWFWEPSQVTVVVDQNGCNGNEDINFRYTGFTLSGRVLGGVGGESCPRKEGPAGVKIILTRATGGETSDEEAFVLTSFGGGFKFVNLIPGSYVLGAFHSKLQVDLTGSSEVTLGWGNSKVDDIFFVPGYNLEGSVVSQGNPVLGVYVYLYSDDVREILCPEGPGNPPWPEKALCHAMSNESGKFNFGSVPCGRYKLVPYYKGENTVFDVSPASIEVNVGHSDVSISRPFQVTGFSVGGRVVDSEGTGVEGVKILVNDAERAITDANGYYKLDQVTSTQYSIQAQKMHYKFSKLENFMVLPNMASMPDIRATHYDLCGSVIVVTDALVNRRQVALTHGPANVKPQTKRVDDSGSFCFEVPPGEYRLSPLTTASENLAGLLFTPAFLDVIINGPVLNSIFTQAQVSIYGTVTCKYQCDPLVSISIAPYISPGSTEIASNRKRFTSLTSESNDFAFERILPGKYKLEIRHEPFSNLSVWDDEWCWERKSLDVDVSINDLTGIEFVQKGFWMHVESTHSAIATVVQPIGSSLSIQIEKGWQQICLEAPGIHMLHFLRSCIFFGTFPFRFDTSNPEPIHLIGQKYLLTGKLYIDSREYGDAKQLVDNLTVVVWKEDGSFADSNNRFQLVTDENESEGTLVLEYNHWARMDDKLVFVPRHLSRDVSTFSLDLEAASGRPFVKQLLFYPRETHVHVKEEGCQAEILPFFGRPGMYIKGNVTPSLEGVNITVLAKNLNPDGNIQEGDISMVVVTGEDGNYVAGPLYDDTEYTVEASKVGYYLRPIDNYSFSCQKLGQIIVHILPGEGAEDQLPSVLLSLSGDDGYRKNAITGTGGFYSFENLFPGSFFLRPLLKEYSFSPAAQAIELGSGQLVEVNFVAKRMAYSVLGTVTSLSGKPEEGIPIEARSLSKGLYEETVTDADGRYRLRGLVPGATYIVKVVLKEEPEGFSKIERASPSSVAVEVGVNDTALVDFVVFDQPSTTILTGYAEGAALQKWQPYLTVQIIAASDPSKIERVIPLPLSYFFEAQGLPRGKYTVKLMCELSGKTHRFESETVDVDMERCAQVDIGAVKFVVEERHHKQDLTPVPVLPAVMGLIVILLVASIPRLKDGYQWVFGSGLSSTSAVPSKKDVRKPTLRKRTY